MCEAEHKPNAPTLLLAPDDAEEKSSLAEDPPTLRPSFFEALLQLGDTHPEVLQKIKQMWNASNEYPPTTHVFRRTCKRARTIINQAVNGVWLRADAALVRKELAAVFPRAHKLRVSAGDIACAGQLGQWLEHLQATLPRLLEQARDAEVEVRVEHVEQGILPGEIGQLLARCACLVPWYCWWFSWGGCCMGWRKLHFRPSPRQRRHPTAALLLIHLRACAATITRACGTAGALLGRAVHPVAVLAQVAPPASSCCILPQPAHPAAAVGYSIA
jgi:hypothetical protein